MSVHFKCSTEFTFVNLLSTVNQSLTPHSNSRQLIKQEFSYFLFKSFFLFFGRKIFFDCANIYCGIFNSTHMSFGLFEYTYSIFVSEFPTVYNYLHSSHRTKWWCVYCHCGQCRIQSLFLVCYPVLFWAILPCVCALCRIYFLLLCQHTRVTLEQNRGSETFRPFQIFVVDENKRKN